MGSLPVPSLATPRSLTTTATPCVGEQQRVLAAEPAPGAGHDRDASLEFNHHIPSYAMPGTHGTGVRPPRAPVNSTTVPRR